MTNFGKMSKLMGKLTRWNDGVGRFKCRGQHVDIRYVALLWALPTPHPNNSALQANWDSCQVSYLHLLGLVSSR